MIDLDALLVNDFEHSFRIEATAVYRCARKITAFASRHKIVRENRGYNSRLCELRIDYLIEDG